MVKKGTTRRDFLRNVGLGASVTALAPMIPGAARRAQASVRPFTGGQPSDSSPEVELLNGDVLGFVLDTDDWAGDFGWVKFRLHEAYFNDDSAFFIRTDTSDPEFAEANRLVWVPLLTAALSREGATARVYVFEGDNHYGQMPVLSTVPGQDNYTPAWRVHAVSGADSMREPYTSEAAILAAVEAGDLTVEALNLVVNYPVVRWPGGELPTDTKLVEALGGGPLVAPVDTDRMEVTFKLHQCYPGSRYIVTDTSAVPMAPMMSITGSGATALLAEVGAVDNIWVFGNGLDGPGVMGKQPAVFRFEPGTPAWSPFWNHFTVTWNDPDSARVLRTGAEVEEGLAAGEIEVWNGTPDTHPDGFVVNCPVPIKARNTYVEPM